MNMAVVRTLFSGTQWSTRNLLMSGSTHGDADEPLNHPAFAMLMARVMQMAPFMVREDHTWCSGTRLSTSCQTASMAATKNVSYLTTRISSPTHAQLRLAFISWNHPNMPWHATGRFGRLGDEGLTDLQVVAGEGRSQEESVLEPVWAEDGTLYFLSDRSGFWNLYRWRAGAVEPRGGRFAAMVLLLWDLGASSYAVASNQLSLWAENMSRSSGCAGGDRLEDRQCHRTAASSTHFLFHWHTA